MSMGEVRQSQRPVRSGRFPGLGERDGRAGSEPRADFADRAAGVKHARGPAMKRFLLALVIGLASACERSTAPVAGLLNVGLTTPNSGGDAAILVGITGPAALTSVSAPTGLRLFTQPLSLGVTALLMKWLRGARYIYNVPDLQVDVARQLGFLENEMVLYHLWGVEQR